MPSFALPRSSVPSLSVPIRLPWTLLALDSTASPTPQRVPGDDVALAGGRAADLSVLRPDGRVVSAAEHHHAEPAVPRVVAAGCRGSSRRRGPCRGSCPGPWPGPRSGPRRWTPLFRLFETTLRSPARLPPILASGAASIVMPSCWWSELPSGPTATAVHAQADHVALDLRVRGVEDVDRRPRRCRRSRSGPLRCRSRSRRRSACRRSVHGPT